MENLRLKISEKVIIGHINIKSSKNKLELLTEMVWDKVNLPMITEIKVDSSFPDAQFYVKCYSKPYRLDKKAKEEVYSMCQGRYTF